MNAYLGLSRFWRAAYLTLISACFTTAIACGGGSSSITEQPVAEAFPEKIATVLLPNGTVTNNLVVFAVEVADGRFELFSVDPSTGVRTGISDTFSASNGLRPVALSPDNSRVGYRADKDNNGTDELYTNSIDGSNEVLIVSAVGTSTTDNSGTVIHYNWQWLDNDSLVFRSDPDSDGVFEIQTINADGSDLVEVSADLSVRCVVADCWKVAASSITFLVEAASQSSEIAQSLHTVAFDGTGLVELNQTLAADSRILDWQFAPDNTAVLYISQNIGSPAELYSVTLDASQRTLLSGSGLSTGVSAFAWDPDEAAVETRIAFAEDASLGDNVSLYSVLPDGSDRIHLIDTFDVNNPVVTEWQWAPLGSRIAYRADQEAQGLFELFTVESDGEWHRKMNPPMLPENLIYPSWQWSASGNFVSFLGEFETARTLDELYSSAADGSQSNRVNLDLTSDGSLVNSSQQWTGDGTRLIYQVTGDNQVDGIYSVLPDGTDSARISESLQSDQSLLSDYALSPDSTKLLYQINLGGGNVSLQIADIGGGNRINLATTGTVSQPSWLADNSRIIYVVNSATNVSEQFYSILPDGTGRQLLY